MKANVFLKTQTYRNVNVTLDKKLNLYKLTTNTRNVYVPQSSINYLVEIPSKRKSSRKRRSW